MNYNSVKVKLIYSKVNFKRLKLTFFQINWCILTVLIYFGNLCLLLCLILSLSVLHTKIIHWTIARVCSHFSVYEVQV